MSSAGAHRNLRVGILALPMRSIDRDRLVTAMRAWLREESKPLDEILTEQGAIDEDTRVLLARIVDQHIDLHAGDPAQSLAAVTVAPDLQHGLTALDDDPVNRSFIHVLGRKAPETPTDGSATTALQFFANAPLATWGKSTRATATCSAPMSTPTARAVPARGVLISCARPS